MKRLAITLAIVLSLIQTLPAAPVYSFRHFTVSDGLSSNTVNAILQDRLGLLWMGTTAGLDSFDGREFISHRFPTEDGDEFVTCLFEDRDGTLWAGTESAVYRFAGNDLVRVDGLEAMFTGITQDRDGALWFSSYEKGVFRYRNGVITRYLDGHSVEALFVSRDGRLWAADNHAEGGLSVFNANRDSFVLPGLTYDHCTPTRVCAISQDADGNLWLGTWDLGLYRVEEKSRTVTCAVRPGPGCTHIHSLFQESPWNFLVGSDDGLLAVNPLTGERTLYGNDRADPESLSNKFVYPLCRDHEGGLWIGTYFGGVNYVSPGIGQFSSFSLTDLAGGSEDYTVSALCEDPDGTLWMGSDNGGLFRYDPARGGAVRWRSAPPDRLSGLNVHALLRSGDDLWIGTYSEKLLRLNVRTGGLKVYGTDDGLDNNSVYSLHEGGDGTVWVGSRSGIARYDKAGDRFILERAVGETVMAIAEDGDGTLWFGTSGKGLLRRSPDGTWREFSAQDGLIPSNHINSLLSSQKGLFVGTRRGVILLGDEGSVPVLEHEDAQSLAYDGTQLWVSTPSVLMRVFAAGGRERFGANDGVRSSQFLPGAGLIARDGKVYFGAADGFISFYPGNVLENRVPPEVILTRAHASGPGLFEDVLARVEEGREVHLPWRLRDLRFTFAALSFIAPEKIRYAYRLEGADSDWQDIGNQNEVRLSQLKPGHYRFRVRACNNSGIWSTEEASVTFSIRPHPLRSTGAMSLYLALLVFLIWGLVYLVLRRMERKSRNRYEQQLDEAVTHLKEEERDDRYQLVSALAEQMEAPLSGIGIQLDRIREQAKASSPLKAELTVIEKNHRMLKGVSASLRQMQSALRKEDDPEADGGSPEEDFLARLDRIISGNLSNPELSVSFLAKEMAISRSGLFAKVKEACGETPNNLINQTRLNAAARLLSEGRHSVGEICYMTGFSSPSYFSKSFTAQFGVTPHEWVRMYRSQENG